LAVIAFWVRLGIQSGHGQSWVAWLTQPPLPWLGATSLAVTLLVCGKRFWDDYSQRLSDGRPDIPVRLAHPSAHFWPWLLGHLLVFGGFFAVTGLVLAADRAATSWPAIWATGWMVLGVGSLASWAAAALPIRFWQWFLRRGWVALPIGLTAGGAAVLASWLSEMLWRPLGFGALWLVHNLLVLCGVETIYTPADFVVGTPAFAIHVKPACSGYQGIGLFCVFLCVYLWLFRHGLRYPQALLLFPIGTAAMWLANVVRLFLLVCLGSWVSPDWAQVGFHSQAGWLALLGVSLGLIAGAHHLRFFSREGTSHEAVADASPLTAYLAPLLALLAASMITSAFSARFDYFYPVRVVAVAGTLWVCRRSYADLRWTWSWVAAGIGVAVFGLWLALVPASTDPSAELAMSTAMLDLPAGWAALWLCFRVVGAVVTVPLAEELAFRGFLTRRLIAREFDQVPLGRFTWLSFLLSSVLFGVLHGQWLAGILAGMGYALALYRRGQLADAVVAHATTNGLLAGYVLLTGNWGLWV
jgi:exosortase E/protease (VPEID-CTERM system)